MAVCQNSLYLRFSLCPVFRLVKWVGFSLDHFQYGIVNLLVGTQCTVELQRRKMPRGSGILGKIDRYATRVASIISFHCWKRPRVLSS